MAKKALKLRKLANSQVKAFKIKNRRGYAATCMNNLTEGRTVAQALSRMNKALKRSGYTLG
ncbi:MAG: hypothetical protein WBD24_04460 [Candidatus Omnitrophota bacterium]